MKYAPEGGWVKNRGGNNPSGHKGFRARLEPSEGNVIKRSKEKWFPDVAPARLKQPKSYLLTNM